MPTDEEIAKILYWTMLNSPRPLDIRNAFGKEFELDSWMFVTGRFGNNASKLAWQHDPIPVGGESYYAASEAATWYVTDRGLEWLKRYEEKQHDTE